MAAVVTMDRASIPAVVDSFQGGSHEAVVRTGTITFDGEYDPDGEDITLSDTGIDAVLFFSAKQPGKTFEWDYANARLKVQGASGPLEGVPFLIVGTVGR